MFLWAVLAISLLLFVRHLPLYSDELTYKWYSGRYFLDDGASISLFPHCGGNFSHPTPSAFLVERLFDAQLYGELSDPMRVRYLGCIFFCLWLVMFWLLCMRLFPKDTKKLFVVSSCLLFLGPLPFLMIMNRPEQTILICFTTALILPFSKVSGLFGRFFIFGSFFLLTAYFVPQHPKTLFLLPALFASCWFLPLNKFARLGLSAYLSFMGLNSYSFFTRLFTCKENPALHQMLSGSMFSPSILLESPLAGIRKLASNAWGARLYFKTLFFSETVQSDWLPQISPPFSLWFFNLLILSIYLIFLFFVIRFHLKNAALNHVKNSWNYQRVMFWTILVSICCLSLFQNIKQFYETSLLLPLIILLVLFSLSGGEYRLAFPRSFERTALAFVFLNFLFLLYFYVSPLRKEWLKGGLVKNQSHSLSAFNWSILREQVERLATACKLENTASNKHLILDDSTYPVFSKTKQPFHVLFVTGYWGVGIENIDVFLKQKESDGLITQCRYLPDTLASKATRLGDFCCLAKF